MSIRHIFIFFLAILPLRAEILWSEKKQKINVSPSAEHIEFFFNFENNGDRSIELYQPQTSCVCTVAELKKKIYNPGEKGVLTGVFKIKNQFGWNSVMINVKGEEVDGQVHRPFSEKLELDVILLEPVIIKPGIILWKKNGLLVEKTAKIEVKQKGALLLKLAEINNSAFSANLIEIEPGRLYDLKVTPISVKDSTQAVVTLEATDDDGKPLRFFVNLLVR